MTPWKMTDTVIRIAVLIAPGLRIDGIDRKDDAFSLFDPRCEGIGHMKVLEIVEVSVLTRDEQDRSAMMSVDLDRHVPIQLMAVVVVVVGLHIFPFYKR